jgi:trans-2-enoyl-CoA reductase
MNRTVQVACCHEWGDPLEVLRVEHRELGGLGANQVMVRMIAAPVNPADINVLEGRYGKRPALPALIGNEGVGEVERVGIDVKGLTAGQWVRPVPGVGTWREALVTEPGRLTPLPGELEPEQAATLCVNPATAWRMLHDLVPLQSGDWVVQNAATSAVGRAVIQIAHHLGLRTVNLVRRAEAVETLQALGADVVLVEDSIKLGRRIEELTEGHRPKLALNGVGGTSALELAKALEPGGTHVTYGAMGRAPLTLPAGLLIFNDLRFCGFWITAWYEHARPDETTAMLDALAGLFRQGVLTVNIEARYPLERARDAVAHSLREGRRGKILLELG